MPVYNLLELNPDKLFEDHTISEIQEIQKRIQTEIERKREELRTMVGERYRDLIEAADTIGDMKVTAEGIISHIDSITEKCQQLQQQHLLGFSSSSKTSIRVSRNNTYYSIAVQMKILMGIPEHIWTALDKEDYLLGAQLYLFASHINTGLQLQTVGEGEISVQQVTQWFPVLVHQWSTISHFHNTILVGCEQKIQNQDITSDEVSNCLCAFALLQGLSSEELLNRFLNLRTHALQKTLKSDIHASVKSRILDSVKLLVHTFSLLQACFVGNGALSEQGLIYTRLKGIVGETAQPAISLVDLSDTIGKKYLPAVIQDFRPSLPKSVAPLPQQFVRDAVSHWLEVTHGFVNGEVVSLLELVGSLRGLAAVRGASTAIQSSHIAVCQSLLPEQKADLWGSFFRPPLSARAHSLVERQWSMAVNRLQESIASAIADISNIRCLQPEHDLRWFIWKEWGADLPQGDQQQQNSRGLLMKAKGYSPRIEKVCRNFDDQLQALLQDLQHYIGDSEDTAIIRSLSEESDEQADRNELQGHLKNCSVQNIKLLLKYLQEKHVDDSEGSLLFLARFLQALCDLCPNLQQCLTPQNSRVALLTTDSSHDVSPWQDVCSSLKHESLSLWNRWRTCVSKKVDKFIAEGLVGPTDLQSVFPILPQWDVVSIEEEGEEGHRIRSNIRVPSQPSLPLQTLLSKVCREINGVVPHTLPRKIHQDFVESTVSSIFDAYKISTEKKCLTQALALQYLLDIKYITLLLVPRDNKLLMGNSQEIGEKLENEVDPFDLDVFSPYIQNNIKKSVQRTQGLLGILIAWPEKLCHVSQSRPPGSGSGTGSGAGSGVDDPSVIAVGPVAPWFPLLPVTGHTGGNRLTSTTQALPPATPQQMDKPQNKKTTNSKSKVDPSPGEIVRSGAAAFFGAMSTDWFG